MDDSRVLACIKEQEQLKSARGVWEGHWRECAERVDPTENFFQMQIRPQGDKRNERIFDDTAPSALPKFCAAVISVAFPATQSYQKLIVHDSRIVENTEVKRFYDEAIKVIFRARYRHGAKFQSESYSTVRNIGLYGTGVLFCDEILGEGIKYKSIPVYQCYIMQDANDKITTMHRVFKLTADQAIGKFGIDKVGDVVKNAQKADPNKQLEFMHCVKPNPDIKQGAKTYHGWDYWSCYICLDDKKLISEGGYRTFPYIVARADTSPNEVYGRSRIMRVLPSIKTANEMKKTLLRAGQRIVSPSYLLSDDGALQAFSMKSDALNYGGLDDQGRPRVATLNSNARVDYGDMQLEQIQKVINDALFVTLFNILKDGPSITATQAMLEAQEKGQLLFPEVGRIQSELIGPLTEREIDILVHSGQFPPMPKVLQDYYNSGGEHHIEYSAPLNQAQRAGEGVAIMNTLQAATTILQIDPTVKSRFNWDKITVKLAESNGFPSDCINSDDEMQAIKDAEANAQQQAQMLQAAPLMASAAKDYAQAGATAASAPNQQYAGLGLQ